MSQEELVCSYIIKTEGVITAKMAMAALGISRGIADKYLSKLRNEGKILRLERGKYSIPSKQITQKPKKPYAELIVKESEVILETENYNLKIYFTVNDSKATNVN